MNVSQFQVDTNYKISGHRYNEDTGGPLYKCQRINRQIKIKFQTTKPKCSIHIIITSP